MRHSRADVLAQLDLRLLGRICRVVAPGLHQPRLQSESILCTRRGAAHEDAVDSLIPVDAPLHLAVHSAPPLKPIKIASGTAPTAAWERLPFLTLDTTSLALEMVL